MAAWLCGTMAWSSLRGTPQLPSTSATNIVSIAAGGSDALALRTDGALIAGGGNYYGQTSVPASATNIVVMSPGGDHNIVLIAGGTVATWGADYFGQTFVPSQATNIVGDQRGRGSQLSADWDSTSQRAGDRGHISLADRWFSWRRRGQLSMAV